MEKMKPAPKRKVAPKKKKVPKKAAPKISKTPINHEIQNLFDGLDLSDDQLRVLSFYLTDSKSWMEVSVKTGVSYRTIMSWKQDPQSSFNQVLERNRDAFIDTIQSQQIKIFQGIGVVLKSYINELIKCKGKIDSQTARVLIQYLATAGAVPRVDKSEKTKADEDKKKKDLMESFEQFVKETITEAQISSSME
jgi:hypothetical protein